MDISLLKYLAYFEKMGTKCPRERERSKNVWRYISVIFFPDTQKNLMLTEKCLISLSLRETVQLTDNFQRTQVKEWKKKTACLHFNHTTHHPPSLSLVKDTNQMWKCHFLLLTISPFIFRDLWRWGGDEGVGKKRQDSILRLSHLWSFFFCWSVIQISLKWLGEGVGWTDTDKSEYFIKKKMDISLVKLLLSVSRAGSEEKSSLSTHKLNF